MTVCAVSTCWRSQKISDPQTLIEEMRATGIDAVELEFRITRDQFDAIRRHRKEWDVTVSSLHAVCPKTPAMKRTAEEFLISDVDEANRERAVQSILATIDNAADVEAGAVVLHCGRTPMDEPIHEMMKRYDAGTLDTDESHRRVHELLLLRTASAKRPFQSLLKSLEEINDHALRRGIKVGLENRYYFGELPNLDEFGVIFNRFEGSALHYWHDTGHAHAQELLFGVSQKVLLETFTEQLIGVHLHDATGYTDHGEPGSGEIDFDAVLPHLKPDTIRVMEMNHRVTADEAKAGVAFLKEKGIFV